MPHTRVDLPSRPVLPGPPQGGLTQARAGDSCPARGAAIRGPSPNPASGRVRRFFPYSCWSRAVHLLATGLTLPLLLAAPNAVAQPDDDPPVLRSGTVDGTTATLTFSEAVVSTDTGALVRAFFLDGIIDGGTNPSPSVSPNAISIDGATVALTFSTGAKKGQTVTVTYEAGTVGNSRLKDAAGNAVEAFNEFVVTNQTDVSGTPPATPVAPTVTGRSTSSVDADWSAPADNGSAITGYDLRYFPGGSDPSSDDDWIGANHSGTATSATIFCLAADSAYRVQVRAVNAGGAGAWSASGAGSTLLASTAPPAVTTTAVSFSVEGDGQARIDVPSSDDVYHVLYYQPDRAVATEYAVAIHMGADAGVTLTEPLQIGAAGAYRVATFTRDLPGDADCDGTDDLTELARAQKTQRAPLNGATPFDPRHGAVAIPDMETFRELSFLGQDAEDERLRGLEHVKLYVEYDGETPVKVYFINSNTYPWHSWFFDAMGLAGHWASPHRMRSEIIYHPYLRAPNGEVGAFRLGVPHREFAQSYELVAASMPFLRNNLYANPSSNALPRNEEEQAVYDALRVPPLLAEDLYGTSVFHALNGAVGYGLLRVFGPGERPTFRDVAILRLLPNDLPTVAGVISLVPQTPLSHVNLRAVQDGVPNAYIGNALEDPTISGLIGRYVRFEVTAAPAVPDGGSDGRLRATWSIREATAEEVAAHHAARRPAAAQTPGRNLAVTTYRDLDQIGFADSDAFGVKAANLATLRTFGFAAGTVPDGYALPFYFYDEFMKHNGFYDDIDTLLADTEFQGGIAVRDAELKKLRRRIRNGAVPDWMATRLAELQALFPTGTSIRCRSSTNNEDLPNFSGTGLYDSYTHHPTEGHLSKSIKQVFASLWNLRAFEEREFHRVNHKATAMGVLLHPNYSDEKANGVAVSDDPFYGSEDRFYVNAQVGEDLVTNPSASAVPEELLLGTGEEFTTTLVQRSNLVADDARVLSEAHIASLQAALRTIHSRFYTLYDVAEDEEFAMEIEFKITAAGTFAVKQARPWVY